MGYPSGGSLATSIRSMEVSTDGSLALRGKTYTIVKSLSANTEATVAVPTLPSSVANELGSGTPNAAGTTGASRVLFNANGDFWVNYDIALSAVPSGDITDGTAPEFKPGMRIITDVTTIHLIAPATTLVSLMFFQE